MGMDIVPARRVIFRSDPLAASDHKTEESRNATMNNWLSYMPRGFCNICLAMETI